MNLFETYLESAKIQNENIGIKQLTKHVKEFRKIEEKKSDWKNDKKCFKGACSYISKDLEKFLQALGYQAQRIQGYYRGASEDFEPVYDDDDDEPYRKYNLAKLPHWWVLVDNKYIVDVTADQFHPGEEDYYRVVVTSKSDSDYKKAAFQMSN